MTVRLPRGMLSVQEVADLLRVHEQTVWRWIKSGKLAASKPGHDWRISPDDVMKLLPDAEYVEWEDE